MAIDAVFLGLNDVGERIYEWLVDREDVHVLALLTHEDQLDLVHEVEPDLIVSAGFRHIVPESVLEVPPLGAANLHKAHLPYNRGANPNVWSIVEENPAGVSIHYMTPDVDDGPLIDRREVPVYPDDTGRTLYDRLEETQFEQFKDVWPAIRDDEVDPIDVESEEDTYHYKEDFVDLWKLDRDETVRVGDFLDRLRALTFPPYRNAYFEEDGERYYVEVNITTEEIGTEPGKNVPRYDDEAEEQP